MVKKCPHCGASEAAKIFYGMPEFSEELEAAIKNGEIFIGGCLITGNDPKYKCRSCGFKYGRPSGDPEQSDFEITAEMYEFYEPSYSTLKEVADALMSEDTNSVFFEYEGKPYIISYDDGFWVQIPVLDFEEIGWRGRKAISGPFGTFDDLVTAPAIEGKSLEEIVNNIPYSFYEGW